MCSPSWLDTFLICTPATVYLNKCFLFFLYQYCEAISQCWVAQHGTVLPVFVYTLQVDLMYG